MPLTPAQARDDYILSSFGQFLARNVKVAYDAIVAPTNTNPPTSRYPRSLTLLTSSPDDFATVREVPSIAIAMTTASQNDHEFELGSPNIRRSRSFTLSCYPSVDATGNPCIEAATILRSLVSDAFDTECISVIDYGNPSCTSSNVIMCPDVMYIRSRTAPIDRSMATALAAEKRRFDMHVSVWYVVTAGFAT
jgi:hypothetical protein